MEVAQGGERETAEWVNALLATFWSLLQPIVSRYSGFEGTLECNQILFLVAPKWMEFQEKVCFVTLKVIFRVAKDDWEPLVRELLRFEFVEH